MLLLEANYCSFYQQRLCITMMVILFTRRILELQHNQGTLTHWPQRDGSNFKSNIFKLIIQITTLSTSCEISSDECYRTSQMRSQQIMIYTALWNPIMFQTQDLTNWHIKCRNVLMKLQPLIRRLISCMFMDHFLRHFNTSALSE